MEKIFSGNVETGGNIIFSSVFRFNDSDILKDVSRVYVLAVDDFGKVPLIFNSKRHIWGFPGGHSKDGETLEETAFRECVEEIKKEIIYIEKKFVIISNLESSKDVQVICFAKIKGDKNSFSDSEESVTEVVFSEVSDVLKKIKNEEVWSEILSEFKKWSVKKLLL